MNNAEIYNKSVFAENLCRLMEKHGERQVGIARLLNVSKSTVSAYCSGGQMPRMDKLQRLAGHFDVALRELIEEASDQRGLNQLERLYYSLNTNGRAELLRTGRELLKDEAETTETEQQRKIKHYTDPAAAGYAAPVAGEDFELIERGEGVPDEADFCITVHGDSMAPYINDGELVYVRRDAPLEEFDVGIFYVDGDIFCKQWCVDYTGALMLLSANPKRQSANIFIPANSGRNCVCFGKVLLPHKLPRPIYNG